MSDWDKRLAEQFKRKYENIKSVHLALDDAQENQEYRLPGDSFTVIAASSAAAEASVKFNVTNIDAITINNGTKRKTVFTRFFISGLAQAGEWLDIEVGIDCDAEQYLSASMLSQVISTSAGVTQPCITLTNAVADQDTQAAAHPCTAVLIKALSTNAGLVWVNFGAAAGEADGYELAAGDELPVPLDNTDKIHALFKTADDYLSILYRS